MKALLRIAAMLSCATICAVEAAAAENLKRIPAGVYRPLFRTANAPKEIPVVGFWLETHPVTNAEFLDFVRENPRWRRSQVKRLFADAQYLQHWANDLEPGFDLLDRPVTFVSWFAAKAYAAWKGWRLPTTAEWELAASAGFESMDGASDPEFRRFVGRWYSSPSQALPGPVKLGRANFFGVYDLHGLVWEWTSDFNSALVTGDAREDNGLDRQLYCGAGSLGASDRSNYAAFMRFGFRSSLKASYTVHNLGFRCAKDL